MYYIVVQFCFSSFLSLGDEIKLLNNNVNDDGDSFDDLFVIALDRSSETTILQMAVDARRAAEVAAKQLLCQADGCHSGCNLPSTASSPWEDLSSSRTAR